MEAVYGAAAAFAAFCLSQTLLVWLKVAGMEAKIEGIFHQLTELQELHPRQGNPGAPEHNGEEHPHDVGGDGLAC